jgi:hypothetical protein
MIIQSPSRGGDSATDVTFTVAKTDLPRVKSLIESSVKELGGTQVEYDPEIVKVSIVGLGMRSHAGVAAKTFGILAGGGDPEPGGPGGWTEAERRLPYSRDFDPDVLRLDNYIPFNTLLAERALFEELAFDPDLPIFEDWDFLIRLARRTPFHHVRRVTCEYRHFRGGGCTRSRCARR